MRGLRSVTLGLVLAMPLAAVGDELPAAPVFSATLKQEIERAISSAGETLELRTRHILADGRARYTNRLILESSPYLLQHAHNPVNWYPWGDAAFAAAREQQKPILLSIGYSTCHWCHVMEHESFDNVEIAGYLNANYIAIKVDREERPDIDRIYMAAVEAFGGNAGWPMTVWLTPDLQPFYGGSYFPAYDGDRGVQRGFFTLLQSLQKVWAENRSGIGRVSDKLVAAVRQRLVPATGTRMPSDSVFDNAYTTLVKAYDKVNGGLAVVPKFPSHLPVRFLLRYYQRSGQSNALAMATHTLEQLARGGINDQIGGGFHRYATDASWRIPHFEKMLYDNALLAMTYLEAYQVTGDPKFADVCRQILGYASRDMKAPGGAFFAASDADSDTAGGSTEEGAYFTWSRAELASVLDARELEFVTTMFGLADNAQERNTLRLAHTVAELAEKKGLPADVVTRTVARAREKMIRARSARPPPYRDTKVLTGWNALMISAFARASLYLDEPEYLDIAERAAGFVLGELQDDGRLPRAYVDGRASGPAFADDYAYLIQASIDLYEAGAGIEWFREATRLQEQMTVDFEDTRDGGFFFSAADHQLGLAREKPGFDGHMPSANAITVLNLLRLYKFTSDDTYRRQAERVLVFFGAVLEHSSAATPYLLHGLDFFNEGGKEIVIVTANGRGDAAVFLEKLRHSFLPNHVLTIVQHGEELERHAKHIPILEGKKAIRGQVTAYVCEHGICDLPTSDPEVFSSQISAGAQ